MRKPNWPAEVLGWRKSGLSMAAYSRERGLKHSTLKYWWGKLKRSELEERGDAEAEAGSRLARVRRRPSPAEAPGSAEAPAAPRESAAIRLVMGPVSVDVPKGFDAETLARLVDVLEGGGR